MVQSYVDTRPDIDPQQFADVPLGRTVNEQAVPQRRRMPI